MNKLTTYKEERNEKNVKFTIFISFVKAILKKKKIIIIRT